ncbi:MAG: hypothetical protein ABSD80_07595 [Caulobacteraceae bacterium]|jgi:hypothetical protein
MIRLLVILTGVSLVVAIFCFVTAFAIVGGPFYIDDNGQFHRTGWSDISVVRQPVEAPALRIS